MKKIISLFEKNYESDRLARNEVVPGAEWVLAGEGVATQKHDGTCCLVRDGKLYKRFELTKSKRRPADFEPATDFDPVTGKQQGWVPIGDGPEDRWHREAVADGMPPDGTYELCGPKVQGNPEKFATHRLIAHGAVVLSDVPRTFDELREWLRTRDIEGIVFHHPDGRMVKIKARDFGIERPG